MQHSLLTWYQTTLTTLVCVVIFRFSLNLSLFSSELNIIVSDFKSMRKL